MSLPQQTWRVSAKYPVTVAGATMTNAEAFVAIKAMFDAEDALGNNYWTYCHYNLTTSGEMIIKRKGSPSGVLGTFRAGIFFTAGTPSALNAGFDVTLGSNVPYLATSENHNADTPAANITAGNVFNGKYSKMSTRFAYINATLESSDAPKVFMVECDRMCSIWFVSSTSGFGGAHFTFGEIVEHVDGTGVWGFISNDATMTAAQTGIETSTAALVPILPYSSAAIGAGCYYDNAIGAARPWGRCNQIFHTAGMEAVTQNNANDIGVNFPIIMSAKNTAGANQAQFTVGVLRQMRFGPRVVGQQIVRDTANVVKGYTVAPGHTTISRGIFYDNQL